MPPPQELVPFLALAKGARGRAVADVVARAIEAPDVHVFGELLDMPSVKEVKKRRKEKMMMRANDRPPRWLSSVALTSLSTKPPQKKQLASSPDLAPYHALLSIFAFGTWSDYKRSASELPQLSAAAAAKLKALTLATLAASGNSNVSGPSSSSPSSSSSSSSSRRMIPYSALAAAVDAASTPELEDLLIRGVLYAGLVDGKLDQRGGGCLKVKSVPASLAGGGGGGAVPSSSSSSSAAAVVGSKCRDVPPDQLKQLAEELSAWRDAVSGAAQRLEAAGKSALVAESLAGAAAEAAKAERAAAAAAALERVIASAAATNNNDNAAAAATANAAANNGTNNGGGGAGSIGRLAALRRGGGGGFDSDTGGAATPAAGSGGNNNLLSGGGGGGGGGAGDDNDDDDDEEMEGGGERGTGGGGGDARPKRRR